MSWLLAGNIIIRRFVSCPCHTMKDDYKNSDCVYTFSTYLWNSHMHTKTQTYKHKHTCMNTFILFFTKKHSDSVYTFSIDLWNSHMRIKTQTSKHRNTFMYTYIAFFPRKHTQGLRICNRKYKLHLWLMNPCACFRGLNV